MLPVHLPTGVTSTQWEGAYTQVKAVFSDVGSVLFYRTYVGYLALFVLLVGIARWLWQHFKEV